MHTTQKNQKYSLCNKYSDRSDIGYRVGHGSTFPNRIQFHQLMDPIQSNPASKGPQETQGKHIKGVTK